jgi:hypothetical protein
MSSKKQTAVEWLVQQIENKNGKEFTSYYLEFIEQAKAMEKQQIIEANEDCSTNELGELFTGEQYYNETYGN